MLGSPGQRKKILDTKRRKELRQIAHHLRPVVIVGNGGVSSGVLGEVERALTDHELIKIRINALERDARAAAISQIVATTGALLVQTIGKIMVLYRANPDTDPELSNITRRAN